MTATSYPSPQELKGAVLGTLLYLALYFGVFIPFQSFSKFYLLKQKKKERQKDKTKISFREIKYYNSKDALALLGDRTVGNFLEFAILFLPLLWMHAIFVDASLSLRISVIYTFLRALYPILFAMAIPSVVLVTFPAYFVLIYLFYQVTFRFALA